MSTFSKKLLKRPRGKAPKGKEWNQLLGWIPKFDDTRDQVRPGIMAKESEPTQKVEEKKPLNNKWLDGLKSLEEHRSTIRTPTTPIGPYQ